MGTTLFAARISVNAGYVIKALTSGTLNLKTAGISAAITNTTGLDFVCIGVVMIPVTLTGVITDPANLDFEDVNGNSLTNSISPGFSTIVGGAAPMAFSTGDAPSVIIPPGGVININNPVPAVATTYTSTVEFIGYLK